MWAFEIPNLLIHGLDTQDEKNKRVSVVPTDQCIAKSGMEHSGLDLAGIAFLVFDQHLVVYNGFGFLDAVHYVRNVVYKLGSEMW